MSNFEVITGADIPKSHLPFSPAIRAGDFVFVSGQASVDDEGNLVSDTFENEFRRSISNAQRILAAAGCTLKDVVQVKSYVKNPSDVPEYNKLYREVFSEPFPARTTIVHCLGKLLYEIDVIAYSPRK
jgi:2-iminobutanoate/2-iminopropanoate deaminase